MFFPHWLKPRNDSITSDSYTSVKSRLHKVEDGHFSRDGPSDWAQSHCWSSSGASGTPWVMDTLVGPARRFAEALTLTERRALGSFAVG